ncbi:MAG: 2-C-methyl-D-erythritol 2,4-cyclodiphosphate synthase, partial [Acidimicrobiia bacterium]|nr:2-C-methyl-D-erythritol 2,4-cyclodiphosphate synthase [Acidimicrobiia bacterium]
MSVWSIVVAGGTGSRFGDLKQFADLAGRRVLDWSLSAAADVSDGVVAVLPPGARAEVPPEVLVATGGATRSASVRHGLRLVPEQAEVVVVHDAARPLARPALFVAVVAAVRGGADAALPGVALSDTIRRRGGGTVDRAELVAVQTPQAFAAAALRRAHAGGAEATDDAGLVEASGGRVAVVPGDPANLKITNPEDLAVAATLLARRRVAAEGRGRDADGEEQAMELRVGQGFDVHAFDDDPARPLVLGGVAFPGQRGLRGHSDADAVAHACTDALLGAAGLGDIGQLFPDTDSRYAGADSIGLLAEAVALLGAAGWRPANVDCTVVCEAPKLAPLRDEIQGRLSTAVGAPVTVKGKRAEGIGSLGRREGIA